MVGWYAVSQYTTESRVAQGQALEFLETQAPAECDPGQSNFGVSEVEPLKSTSGTMVCGL